MAATDGLLGRLQHWARSEVGLSATVPVVWPMPGNAGLSFGFDVVSESGRLRQELVIRLAPPGVRRSGNTDVLRQVPLLRALDSVGLPVARPQWWTSDQSWFGTDAFMVERLAGRPIRMWDHNPGLDLSRAGVEAILGQLVEALALLHAFDWRTGLGAWSEERSLDTEIEFWAPILEKGGEPAWTQQGLALKERLLEHRPPARYIGLVHGDYQSHNALFNGGRLVAIVDWELACIGAQLLDLGWLLMMNDRESWDPVRRKFMWGADSLDMMVERYEAASNRSAAGVTWFRALAGYRFGSIVAFNVMLDRTGKRPDPLYKELGASVPFLFGRALELLRIARDE